MQNPNDERISTPLILTHYKYLGNWCALTLTGLLPRVLFKEYCCYWWQESTARNQLGEKKRPKKKVKWVKNNPFHLPFTGQFQYLSTSYANQWFIQGLKSLWQCERLRYWSKNWHSSLNKWEAIFQPPFTWSCRLWWSCRKTKSKTLSNLQSTDSSIKSTNKLHLFPATGSTPLDHTAIESGCESPSQWWNSSGHAVDPSKLFLVTLHPNFYVLQH